MNLFRKIRSLKNWTGKSVFTWNLKIFDAPMNELEITIVTLFLGTGIINWFKIVFGFKVDTIKLIARRNIHDNTVSIIANLNRSDEEESMVVYNSTFGQRLIITMTIGNVLSVRVNNRIDSLKTKIEQKSGFELLGNIIKNGWVIKSQ